MGWDDEVSKDSFRYLLVGSQTLSTRLAISLAELSDVAINTTVLALNLRAIRSNMAWLTTSAADSGGTVLGIVVSRSVSEVSRLMIENDSGTYCWQWRQVTSITSLLWLTRGLTRQKQLTWLLRTISDYVTLRMTPLAFDVVDVPPCLRIYADVGFVAHPRDN